jgi:hypothetical protein
MNKIITSESGMVIAEINLDPVFSVCIMRSSLTLLCTAITEAAALLFNNIQPIDVGTCVEVLVIMRGAGQLAEVMMQAQDIVVRTRCTFPWK